jgi:predicted MPP superfamily phosphohydrolase
MSTSFVIALGILLGLLFFLYQQVRRAAWPIAIGAPLRKPKSKWRVVFATIPVVIAALVIWAFFIEPNRLVVRHQTIQIAEWPKELSGIRIAVISDIHAGSRFIDDDKLRLIVRRTNELQPSLIVILGDYMIGRGRDTHPPERFALILKDLNAPLGVYSVLGNHDWWFDGKRVREALEANGIRVLDDESTELRLPTGSFWLVGLADLWTRPQRIEPTIAQIPQGRPIIAITHNPDIFPRVPPRVQLLLAGHTHGGQVRFPLIGTVVQASDYGERYVRGHVFEQNHHLFVTTGIGTSIVPVRFSVPPEIVMLTIESQ